MEHIVTPVLGPQWHWRGLLECEAPHWVVGRGQRVPPGRLRAWPALDGRVAAGSRVVLWEHW